MINAKKELVGHIEDRKVQYVSITFDRKHLTGTLEEVLEKLDFAYDNSHSTLQQLDGCIWYADGTWSERAEYDGEEEWVYRKRPPIEAEMYRQKPNRAVTNLGDWEAVPEIVY